MPGWSERMEPSLLVFTRASVTCRLPGISLYKFSHSDQTLFVNRRLCWQFPSKHCMESPLHCNQWNRTPLLAFYTWDAILNSVSTNSASAALQTDRFENSKGTNHKLDLITFSNTFSVIFLPFPFTTIVRVIRYEIHTLHMNSKQCGIIHWSFSPTLCFENFHTYFQTHTSYIYKQYFSQNPLSVTYNTYL